MVTRGPEGQASGGENTRVIEARDDIMIEGGRTGVVVARGGRATMMMSE